MCRARWTVSEVARKNDTGRVAGKSTDELERWVDRRTVAGPDEPDSSMITWSTALQIVASAAAILAVVVALIRLNGLRSLSKMSSFDFVVTIAVGSIIASTVLSDSVSPLEGMLGVVALLFSQRLLARARVSANASVLVDNTPVVLMVGERMLDDTLARVRVTRDDIRGKLREANVIELSEVHVVVLESTGDISVLHGSGDKTLDGRLLEGVKGGDEALRELGGGAT